MSLNEDFEIKMQIDFCIFWKILSTSELELEQHPVCVPGLPDLQIKHCMQDLEMTLEHV